MDNSIVVYTKEELEKAKNEQFKKIIVKGELADKLYKSKEISSLSKKSLAVVTAAIGVGLALAPFTAGTSTLISGIATSTAGTGISTVLITSCVFFGVSGITLIYAIHKDYHIKIIYKDISGSITEVELTKKNA